MEALDGEIPLEKIHIEFYKDFSLTAIPSEFLKLEMLMFFSHYISCMVYL
jgi:hypothetical protein